MFVIAHAVNGGGSTAGAKKAGGAGTPSIPKRGYSSTATKAKTVISTRIPKRGTSSSAK